MHPAFAPSREMNALQLNLGPIGRRAQTPFSSTAVPKMELMSSLDCASTEPLFIVEELDKGTSSELNTPEVVCTNWKFQRQASHGRGLAPLVYDASHPDEELSKADQDPYSSFSSSNQLEQRMNLESYFSSHGCLSEGSFTGDENKYTIMQPAPSLNGAMAESEAFKEEPSEFDIFPCLGDKNFQLPPEIVQLMDEILPSEKENVVNNSAEFDMFVGSQDPLADAIKFTGILSEDPSWNNLDKEVTTINMDDIEFSDKEVLTINMDTAELPGNVTLDNTELPDVVTLSPTSTSVHILEPAEEPMMPEPVEVSPVSEDPLSVTTMTRSRRRVKKPDRYRGTALDMDSEIVDTTLPYLSAHTKRPRQSLMHMTEEEKYARIRQLNNEASKRCRTNKKKQVQNMANEVKELAKENERLQKRVQHLESLRDQMKDFVHNFFRDQITAAKK